MESIVIDSFTKNEILPKLIRHTQIHSPGHGRTKLLLWLLFTFNLTVTKEDSILFQTPWISRELTFMTISGE